MKVLNKKQLTEVFYAMQNKMQETQDYIFASGGNYNSTAKQFPLEFETMEKLSATMARIRKCLNR
jgi:hypothetical protein